MREKDLRLQAPAAGTISPCPHSYCPAWGTIPCIVGHGASLPVPSQKALPLPTCCLCQLHATSCRVQHPPPQFHFAQACWVRGVFLTHPPQWNIPTPGRLVCQDVMTRLLAALRACVPVCQCPRGDHHTLGVRLACGLCNGAVVAMWLCCGENGYTVPEQASVSSVTWLYFRGSFRTELKLNQTGPACVNC